MSQARTSRLRTLFPVVAIAAAAVVGWQSLQGSNNNQPLTLSGTIEATEINLASQIGGLVKQVYVSEGDTIRQGEHLVDIYSQSGDMNESITSPIDGVVLERLTEPGELAAPGTTLVVVANLDTLTLKVFAPEDRYGGISLGQSYPVTVDAFPNVSFSGKVSRISDQAEFTTRNVQTVEGRKSTVYAIKLTLVGTGGRLKPGMPAAVTFDMR